LFFLIDKNTSIYKDNLTAQF